MSIQAKSVFAFVSLIVALSIDSTRAASLDVVGGTLTANASGGERTDSQTLSVSSELDVYSAQAISTGNLFGNPNYTISSSFIRSDNSDGALSVLGSAYRIQSPAYHGTAYVSGSIEFTVSAPTQVNVYWSSSWGATFDSAGGTLTLLSGSDTLLRCGNGTPYNYCITSPTSGSVTSLLLAAGLYQIDASTSTPIMADGGRGFSFSLTPVVPLPAAAWLLMSGIAGLVGVGLKRSSV